MGKKPAIENAPFPNDAPITIRRAIAGGFLIEIAGEISQRHAIYAACSTAEETAALVRDMLLAGESGE